ncbi:hypothetical protein B0T19DRAFT_10337 [Cercophora scortea]|uniref:Vacuolar protein sorting/targeting protein 10 n=1 Tax=Cercophora scortea TaxID=314031 RepID=A0AAE0MKZ1_9PEZI|nr:hypothetical protein B0T19DRAFT_10337 [Cercophora scortea]
MRVRGALQAAALLTSVLWATPLWAKKDHPAFKTTKFEHRPTGLNYFPDSDVILFQDIYENNVYRSADAGATWDLVDDVPKNGALMLFMHRYDLNRAYILTESSKHYLTSNRGKTWEKFDVGISIDIELAMFDAGDIMHFHASDPDRIIFNGIECLGPMDCRTGATYTTDGFKTDGKLLRTGTSGCWWAKSSELFSTGSDDLDKDRILCIAADSFSTRKQDQRLLISDNFFKKVDSSIQEFEPNLDTDKAVQGIVNIAVVKKYLLVATTSLNTDELALFVTDDTKKWHRAMFPTPHDSHDHRIMQEAYTVLASTNYSIQIDVRTTGASNPMGILLTSNSNGTFFTENIEHTNRNRMGTVDFEEITGIQGIFLVNKVDNWEEIEKKTSNKKKVVSEITFDDGRTFESVTADGKRIHLHSLTELSNVGRVFSSPAPGLVMAVGNTGDYLKDYLHGNLYVSDDAGMTWSKALDGPHKYEFGDQGSILVAIKDSEKADVDEISYSLDHGKTWTQEPLPNDLKIRPYLLTTTQDSTSLQFVLVGLTKKDGWEIISINFDDLHEDTCKDEDLEEWFARVDKDGKPTCLMGHTQSFRRRKKDAKCFLKQEFKHAVLKTTDCDCTELDYECDYNFVKEDGKCVLKGPIPAPENACRDGKPESTFLGTSGYRKIPGNTCKPTRELDEKYKDVERKCSDIIDAPSAPATDELVQERKSFGKWDEWEKHYLERGQTTTGKDESIIMQPKSGSEYGPVFVTQDHGKTWTQPKELKDEKIRQIIPHSYFKDMAFFITEGKEVKYTVDRGNHFHHFIAPTKADTSFPLAFHPDKKDWLLWMGQKCDDECYRIASYSTDRGDSWKTAGRYIQRCEFTGSSAYKYPNRKEPQIVCLRHEREDNEKDNPLALISTNDWFEKEDAHLKGVSDYATMAEFIVVASYKSNSLQASVSLDGTNFAPAHFPYGFDATEQHGYTVLDSSTHAVNLFVATAVDPTCRLGSILKSNSNGTSYVLSVANVNCNSGFFVDYEKMLGLEGVALVNVVSNPNDKSSTPKKLQTQITHNDGSQWRYLPPPGDDDLGKFPCHSGEGDDKCALHIHGYTERRDHGKTFSSDGAVGLMIGWGNVGPFLDKPEEADTFMTTDAGISWKRIKKGRWSWAFGDLGSIIVLVQTTEAVKKSKFVSYSLDQGVTWHEHEFSKEEVEISEITTQRHGGSLKFLLWGKDGDGLFTVQLDFDRFFSGLCKHDDDLSKSDYTIFSPKHPLQQDGCLFGHVSQYLRKKPDVKCHNDFKMQPLYTNQNCTCTREDFECDFNFQLDNHGQCSLVQGLSPLEPTEWCKSHPDEDEYYEPTGYRRIPLTTCVGGKNFDTESEPHPCPGHEEEFERKHATSGIAIFFAVVIPFAAAAAVGWYVWRNWTGKFGQIRLGEQGGTSALDSERPWVRYPVIALSAIVAVVIAMPLVASTVWRSASGLAERWGLTRAGRGGWSRLGGGGGGNRTYTTRDSFARGRGDYAVVDEDEGELLGEDSDEEVV